MAKKTSVAKHKARIAELEEELQEAQEERDALKDRLTAARVVLVSDDLDEDEDEDEDEGDDEDEDEDEDEDDE